MELRKIDMKSKKGIQLSQAFGAVLTLVLVAVLIIIAIVIFVNLNSSFAGTTSVSVTNESLVMPGTGIIATAGAANCSFFRNSFKRNFRFLLFYIQNF